MTFKELIKESKTISRIAYGIRRFVYKTIQYFFWLFPLEKKTVIFSNFNGRGFAGNPKAIAQMIHQLDDSFKLIWVCESQKAIDSLPEYVTAVKYESLKYLKSIATSGCWVFNLTLQDFIVKRSGQLYIQTWHGDRGIKAAGGISMELESYSKTMRNVRFRETENCDFMLSGSKFCSDFYRRGFKYDGVILESGCPRNDCLVNVDQDKVLDIKNKLNIKPETKVLLYAPTFRDHLKNEEANQSDIDLNEVMKHLRNKDEKWVCLVRAHSGNKIELINKVEGEFLDVTSYTDMADLLLISDLLISDYSSCAGDFILTGKPVILYWDDYEVYKSEDRGLLIDKDTIPYFTVFNMKELIEMINSLTDKTIKENNKKVQDYYQVNETGKASYLVASEIISRQTGKEFKDEGARWIKSSKA